MAASDSGLYQRSSSTAASADFRALDSVSLSELVSTSVDLKEIYFLAFLHSQGGTGSASAHKPTLLSRAVSSALP